MATIQHSLCENSAKAQHNRKNSLRPANQQLYVPSSSVSPDALPKSESQPRRGA